MQATYIVRFTDSGKVAAKVQSRAEAIAKASEWAIAAGVKMEITEADGKHINYVTSRGLSR